MKRSIIYLLSLIIAVTIVFNPGAPVRADTLDVAVTWTNPGDDSTSGTAAAFFFAYGVNDTAGLTTDFFNQPIPLGIIPAPDTSGTQQNASFTIPDIPANSIVYLAVRTRDEAWNWSGISNLKVIYSPDTIPPNIILDLDATIVLNLSITLKTGPDSLKAEISGSE